MGGVISKAANGIGGVIGNAFTAPFKTILVASCEDLCSGPWDVVCFVEHLCISDLVKLLMIFGLCYIILMFFYLLFKVGICQCILRSFCKMCWAACETYWSAVGYVTCFLWHKLKNTKHINRRRFRDIEVGYCSSDERDFLDNYHHVSVSRKQYRKGKRNPLRTSHHHLKLKTREVSVHVKGRSRKLRNSRQLQYIKVINPRREVKNFKKRRFK